MLTTSPLPDHPAPVVVAILLAPRAKAPMQRVASVEAEAGRGLVGDRYHAGLGAMSRWPGPAREVTLVSEEALAEASAAYGASVTPEIARRNVVVRGADLDALVKRRFRIGGAVFEGVQRCLPCAYLERVNEAPGLLRALVGRGGLRARVVESGALRVGDVVVIEGG